MALALFDRVQETTTTTGTGAVTLAGAVSGFQSFAVVGNGNTCYYTILDGTAWEVGIGTYSSVGPSLARTTVLSNSSGTTSPLTLASGTKTVFLTYPAEKSVNLDASGNVSPLGTVSSGVWQGSKVEVAYGGTGVTTSSGANSVMLRDANQNVSINRLNQSSTTVTAAAGTTTLTAASTFSQILTGTGGQTFKLPDATTLTNTTTFEFNNNATGTLTITDNASAVVGTISSGGAAAIALLANGTVGGTWDVHAYIPENVTWGTNSLALGSTVITGGTWNGGVISTAYGGTGLSGATPFSSGGALYATSTSALTSGTLPASAGGTGSQYFTVSGPTVARTYTFPDASTTILTTNALVTPAQGGTGVNNGSSTITLAGSVTHAGAFARTFTATGTTSVTLPTSGYLLSSVTQLGSNPVTGTPTSSNYLRGDGTWAAVPSSMVYPGAGIANSTGSAWSTSYGVSGTGTTVALTTGASFSSATLNGVLTLTTAGYFKAAASTGYRFNDSTDTYNNVIFSDAGNITARGSVTGTSFTASSGAVTSAGNTGFRNDVYYSGARNPIWAFGNATAYGLSYFQGTAGIGGADTIGLHPNGNATAAASSFSVTSAGNGYFLGFVSADALRIGSSSNYLFSTAVWAGTGGYPGYQFTGGNSRFGFSSTGGYVDVYTDGNFYAGIDQYGSNFLIPHAGNSARTNWNSNFGTDVVVGQLAWKNYGNYHTIFDASAGTSPQGTGVGNTNPTYAWSGTYPTLMGWNGGATYGVRVDSSRYSENVAGLVANTGTYSSYGGTATTTLYNSYYGLLLGNSTNHLNVMADSGGNGGFYRQGSGLWPVYYNVGDNCVGITTSTTSSAYRMYVPGSIYSSGNVVIGGNTAITYTAGTAPGYVARAFIYWTAYNGFNIPINYNVNFSSATYVATGRYNFTYTTGMPDSYASCSASSMLYIGIYFAIRPISTTGVRVNMQDSTFAYVDADGALIVFR